MKLSGYYPETANDFLQTHLVNDVYFQAIAAVGGVHPIPVERRDGLYSEIAKTDQRAEVTWAKQLAEVDKKQWRWDEAKQLFVPGR